MFALTHHERELLRRLGLDIGVFIACPESWIEDKQHGTHSGGGKGFDFQYTRKGVTGQWFEWFPERRNSAGHTSCYGELLREVTMPYTRLRKWRATLPASVLTQAMIWYRTHPENTRDLAALARLTAEQLADEPTLFDVD